MTFLDFCRGHGILIDELPPIGVWRRYKTETKPGKKNGAVIFNGDSGAVQNWEFHTRPEVWKPDANVRPITDADRAAYARKRAEREETQEKQWARAAHRAQALIDTCKPGVHGYPARKGFPDEQVLVSPDGEMVVPMRSAVDNSLVGTQTIRWLIEERQWEKRFSPGVRAKGAVYRFGSRQAPETIIAEGWATARSLVAACDVLRLRMSVVVAFSAGNIPVVAPLLRGRVFVYADRDESLAGQNAAEKTGLPWAMPPEIGDANDFHVKHGLRALAGQLLDLRRRKA